MIELTDEMRDRLAAALTDGYPVTAASIEPDGYPKLSFYGSCQVFSDDQLALWHRNPDAGLVARLASSKKMALLYRHSKDRVSWQFYGRARIVDDDADAVARIYDNMPEIEKMFDPEHKGKAIIIDVDRVTGRGLDMRRESADAPQS